MNYCSRNKGELTMNKFQQLKAAAGAALEAEDTQAFLLAFSEFAGFPITDAHLRKLYQILSVQA